MTESGSDKTSFRTAEDLLGVPRAMARSHARTQKDVYAAAVQKEESIFSRAGEYLRIRWLAWVWHYLRSRLGGKYKFGVYPLGLNGIYDLVGSDGSSSRVKVSLTGDFGTGTEDAYRVSNLMARDDPDFTLHLGDVYYVGTKSEMDENFFGERVSWPFGRRGTFSLNSNHEMYARGKPYFTHLLPKLGIRTADAGKHIGQHASYFALRNDHWIIIGLDTGYYSVGLPIIEKFLKPSCKLHLDILKWLRTVLQVDEDRSRGIILLTHHQYYSQFESAYERAAKQLSTIISRPVIWFWGHEHRLAVYGKHATERGRLQAYGRCVGHGGMPIEDIVKLPKDDAEHRVGLVFYDARTERTIGPQKTPVGFNGFANLLFENEKLTIEYRDTEDRVLVREQWTVEDGGRLRGVSIEQPTSHPDLRLHAPSLENAIA